MGPTFVLLTASFLAPQVAVGQVASPMPAPNCNCGTPAMVQTIQTSGVSGGTVFTGQYRGNGVFEETVQAPAPAKNATFMSRLQGRFSGMFSTRSKAPKNNANNVIETTEIEDGTIIEVNEPIAEGTMPAGVPVNRMPNATSKASFNEPPLQGSTGSANVIITNKGSEKPADSTVVPVNFRPAQVAPAQTASAKASVLLPKFVNKVGHEEDYSWITGQLGQVNGRWTIHYASAETVDRFQGSLVLAGSVDMSNLQVGDLVSIHGGVIQTTTHGPAYLIQTINLIERK